MMKYTLLFLLLFVFQSKPGFSQELTLAFHWADETLVGSSEYNNTYNEVWGLVVNDREFAVIGSTAGTHIFDISDIESVSQVAFIEGAVANAEIIHRDYHDIDGLLYCVAAEGASTLQIVDITNLPESVEVVYDSGEIITAVHNIFIDTSAHILYGCGVQTGGGFGLNFAQYDISEGLEPVLVNTTAEAGYVHDVYVRNSIAYIDAGSSGGLYIIDYSDPTDYVVLGTMLDYSAYGQGYTHSGWLSEDGSIYALADETPGLEMKICDVSDPTDIQVLSTCSSEVDPGSMAHNQMITGDYLFTAYYHDGLVIHDISDPSDPKLVASYDTYSPPDHDSYRGAWGVYSFLPSGRILVSDMQYGLFVFDFDWGEPAVSNETLATNSGLSIQVLENSFIQWHSGPSDTEELILSFYDVQGRLLMQEEFDANLSSGQVALPNGTGQQLVIVRLQQGEKQLTEKVIVGSKL